MGTQSTWGLLVLQKVTAVKMKVLLLSATLALASAGFAPSCEECNAAAAGLLARLTSADSIAEQTGILISQVCPQAADAAACEAGLSQWWGDMAMCLYPAFIGAGDACEQLGLCNFMQEPSTIEQGVAVLTGDCFCGAEGHTAECPDLVNSLAEPCMQVLSAVLMETTPELCQDIVGVC